MSRRYKFEQARDLIVQAINIKIDGRQNVGDGDVYQKREEIIADLADDLDLQQYDILTDVVGRLSHETNNLTRRITFLQRRITILQQAKGKILESEKLTAEATKECYNGVQLRSMGFFSKAKPFLERALNAQQQSNAIKVEYDQLMKTAQKAFQKRDLLRMDKQSKTDVAVIKLLKQQLDRKTSALQKNKRKGLIIKEKCYRYREIELQLGEQAETLQHLGENMLKKASELEEQGMTILRDIGQHSLYRQNN